MNIVFSEDDLRLFSEASRDRNPLHLSAAYARSTSFGRPVVFGALGVLAALCKLEGSEPLRIQTLSADFHRPMFVGVPYRAARIDQGDVILLRLYDGSVHVLSVVVKLAEIASPPFLPVPASNASAHLKNCKRLSWAQIAESQKVIGDYAIDTVASGKLLHRFSASDIGLSVVQSLLWSSYFVGMELPGERALFFRCVLKFPPSAEPAANSVALQFCARVRSLNPGIHQVRVAGTLTSGSDCICSAELVAFFRPDVGLLPDDLSSIVEATEKTSIGKVALVLGASRGLGAAIAALFAQSGAEVVACARSGVRWTTEVDGEAASRVQEDLVDAADPAALSGLLHRVTEKFGRLDFLVCNAFPPIPALRLEQNAFERLRAYINDSVALALAPMCVFLDLLNKSGGTLIVISSSAVDAPVREWPHYVAAKAAADALASVASQQFERINVLVFRPERMLTEMTNTPLGRANAESPGRVAEFIVRKAISEQSSTGYEVVPVGAKDLSVSASQAEVLVSQ